MRKEREKANLLPERTAADGLPSASSHRRPADVWLPQGSSGKGEALDFKVSSGLQSELLHPVAETPGLVFHRYDGMKRSFKDTAPICEAAAFKFVPPVVEAHSRGWSLPTRATVDWISCVQATSHHEDVAYVSSRITQHIFCTLHKESARAILRRSAVREGPSFLSSGWDIAGND